MEIKPSKKFTKTFEKLPDKIQASFAERIELFINDPFHPLLNNHKLAGKYINHKSINITSDYRLIFKESGNYSIVYLETIGTHSQLYK
jgi:addiction module RelE/StbE family toxin